MKQKEEAKEKEAEIDLVKQVAEDRNTVSLPPSPCHLLAISLQSSLFDFG